MRIAPLPRGAAFHSPEGFTFAQPQQVRIELSSSSVLGAPQQSSIG